MRKSTGSSRRKTPSWYDITPPSRASCFWIGKGSTELVPVLRRLWRTRYELVIDLQGQLRSALFTLATGAPVRIGFDRPVHSARSESERHEPRNVLRYRWTGARDGSWIAYSHRIPIPT